MGMKRESITKAVALLVCISFASIAQAKKGDYKVVDRDVESYTTETDKEIIETTVTTIVEKLDDDGKRSSRKSSSRSKAGSRSSASKQAMFANARPGECFAEVLVPAEYEMAAEEVMVKEASQRIEIIPAEYEWVEEEVLIKGASEKLEIIPAEYEDVTEEVMVKPASVKVTEVAAKYEWIEEEILIEPGRVEWKEGRGPIEKIDNLSGDIICLVKIPPKYDVIKKKVLVEDATTEEVDIPAEYEKVTKTVMVKPPSTKTVDIPAEFKNLRVKRLKKSEERKVVDIPAEYKTIERKVVVSEGGPEWRRILCETNMDEPMVTKIQEQLNSLGYNIGKPDGALGPKTYNAIEKYQKENNLPTGGITIKTLKKMGIRF